MMKKLWFLAVLVNFALILILVGVPKQSNNQDDNNKEDAAEDLDIKSIKELSYKSSNRWIIKVPKNIKKQDVLLLDPEDLQDLGKQAKVARMLSQKLSFDNQILNETTRILSLKNNNFDYEKVIIKKDGSVYSQIAKQELSLAKFSANYFYNPQLFLLRHVPAVKYKLSKSSLLVKRTSNLRKQIIIAVKRAGNYKLYLINLTANNEQANSNPLKQKVILPLEAYSHVNDQQPPVVIPTPTVSETPVADVSPTESETPVGSQTPAISQTPFVTEIPSISSPFPSPPLPTPSQISPAVLIKDFWPSPKSGNRSILRFYDHVQNGAITKNHMIQRIKLDADTGYVKYISVEDWVKNVNQAYVWASTWYLTIDIYGTVTETADAVCQYDTSYITPTQWLDLKYIKGNEILWGNYFPVGHSVQGNVVIDTSISTIHTVNSDGSESIASYADGASAYGYNSLKYVQPFVNKQLSNGTFYSGSFFSLYQTFCGKSCGAPEGWEVWVNYYMTPNVGPVRMDYYRRSEGETLASDQGSHELTWFCEADRESFTCS